MLCKIYLNLTEQYSFKIARDNIGFGSITFDTIDVFIFNLSNSCYLNNKVICEKFGVLLSAGLGHSLYVHITPQSTQPQ